MARRSKQITLLMMAGSAITLSACGEPADTEVVGDLFTSKAECIAALNDDGTTMFTASQCEAADREARAEHVANAPKFATREQCEAEFGPAACTPTATYASAAVPAGATAAPAQSSTSSFMPFMMGYMMGNMGSNNHASPIYYAPNSYNLADRSQRPLVSSAGSAPRTVGFATPRSTASAGASTARTSIVSPSVRTGGVPSASSISQAKSSSVGRSSSSFSGKAATSSRGGFGSIGSGKGGGFS